MNSDNAVIYMYESRGFFYAYLDTPFPLFYMGERTTETIHDHECKYTGCLTCVMDAVNDDDWYGI